MLITPAQKDTSWYAVLTRSRQEKVAATMLEHLEVATYLPLATQERRWSDRTKRVSAPLFPSYLFVHIERSNEILLRVLKVPGIVDFVRNQQGPAPIADREIENVRQVTSQDIACEPHAWITVGDRVRVVRGALSGIEGLLLRCGSQDKLVLSVEMLQRSVTVNVDASDVERVFPASHAEAHYGSQQGYRLPADPLPVRPGSANRYPIAVL